MRLLDISTPEDAERELNRIKVDPTSIPLMTAKMLTRCVHLGGISCGQAKYLKQELLALGGDVAVVHGMVASDIEPIDVVLIGTEKQLRDLCDHTGLQNFDLLALATQLRTVLANLSSRPLTWRTGKRTISLGRPLIMGILNVTPDSFSDGTCYLSPEQAVKQAWEMVEQGADIIDIGGESTRPGAVLVDAAEELRRVMPVLEQLQDKLPCPISIDTWKSGVARAALQAGAEIINDISGFIFDPAMAALAAQTGAGAVLMHTRGKPDSMQKNTDYTDLMGEVIAGLDASIKVAVAAGMERDCIAIDPGIGFGKNTAANLEILRRLRELSGFGLPVLVGTSRKGFIGKILSNDLDSRINGTAATVALAVANGASILRVHDVRAMRDAADMAHAIING